VFGFPQREAAQIAVRTVRAWLDESGSALHVIFNVFGQRDEEIYRGILGN
jgi:O-acetyl-ADP-ribose deacetylase (regulator of RNase III)